MRTDRPDRCSSLKFYKERVIIMGMDTNTPSRRKRTLAFKWEIALALALKLVLLIAIWTLCFDQPMSREKRAENTARVILNR